MAITAQDLEKFEARMTEGKHQLAVKARQDASFHDALTKNPQETIETFFHLKEGTLENVAVDVHVEKPGSIGIVIPPRPEDAGAELSEDQLEAVAGGAIVVSDNPGSSTESSRPGSIREGRSGW